MDLKNQTKARIISVIASLLILGGIGAYFAFNSNDEQSEDIVEEEIEQVEETSVFEEVNGLVYELKRSEVIKDKDGKASEFIMDIIFAGEISKEEWASLESEVYRLAKEEYGNDIQKVIIHVFQTSDKYEEAVKEGYKGNYGLRMVITGDHAVRTPVVTAKYYQEIEIPELNLPETDPNEPPVESEGDIDAFEYDAQDAKIEGKKATIDVIANGPSQDVAKFIIGFIQVTRELNKDIETYALNIYSNRDTLERKEPQYVFDGKILTYEEVLENIFKNEESSEQSSEPSSEQEKSPAVESSESDESAKTENQTK